MKKTDFSILPYNFALLLQYIAKRGVELEFLPETDVIVAKNGRHIEYFVNYQTRLTPSVYQTIIQDKFYCQSLMKYHGISVSPNAVFDKTQYNEAVRFANKIGYPVVLKPTFSRGGIFVYPNLLNETELRHAFTEFGAATYQRNMMIERHFHGDEYRFFLIDKVAQPFIITRRLPVIQADGVSTIEELVNIENNKRLNPRLNCSGEISFNYTDALRALEHQGYKLSSIPTKGKMVILRYNANVSTGSECITLENKQIHITYINLAKQIYSLFPGLGFMAVDLLIKDVTVPCRPDNYVLCECVVDPGFSLHHTPSSGSPQDVLNPIIDLIFPETMERNLEKRKFV